MRRDSEADNRHFFNVIQCEDDRARPNGSQAFLPMQDGVLCPPQVPGPVMAADRGSDGPNPEEHWSDEA